VSSFEQRLCRLAEEAADAEDPLRALETLVELRGELEAITRTQVQRGLRAGSSFSDIARALGVSRQAAHRRFRDLAGTRVAPTTQARLALRLAREEALTANAPALGSEHLLIAVLRCHGHAAQALAGEGLTLELARTCARKVAAERGRSRGSGDPPAGLRDSLREATRIVVARGGRWLDVNALLLAALADADGAGRVLTALGIDPAAVRSQLDRGAPHPPAHATTRHRDAA
jgi:AraC-like DNA-binding protein